jgi:hypothetical protein
MMDDKIIASGELSYGFLQEVALAQYRIIQDLKDDIEGWKDQAETNTEIGMEEVAREKDETRYWRDRYYGQV